MFRRLSNYNNCLVGFVCFSISTFISCTNHSESNNELLQSLDEGFVNTNHILDLYNQDLISLMDDGLKNPATHDRAKVWKDNAERVHTLSENTCNYLEKTKQQILNSIKNQNKSQNISNDKEQEVYSAMVSFKENLLQVDSKIENEFKSSLLLFTRTIDTMENRKKYLDEFYLKKLNEFSTVVFLSRLINNIKIIENKIIQFCYEKAVTTILVDTFYEGISLISSSVVKPGENIQIISGLGTFTTNPLPRVFVYGKSIPVNEAGIAIFEFRAEKKPGKYFVPVIIKFVDDKGGEHSIAKKIEYIVVDFQKE